MYSTSRIKQCLISIPQRSYRVPVPSKKNVPYLHNVRSLNSRSNSESKVDIGGTFAAYYKGDLVVNLWGGYADQKAHRMWKKDTLPCVYSTTKSASSVVIAHMVDRYELLN